MRTLLPFLTGLFTVLAFPLYGQRVTVRNKTTLQPLPHVAIYPASAQAAPPRHVAWTDQAGQADLSGFAAPAGLIFQATGYQPLQRSLAQLAADGYEVVLAEKTYSLDEVVVSASKFAEKRTDVAQQTQVLGSSALTFMNQPTAAEVLQQSGYVAVQKSQQGGGSPVLRGFEANKVLLVVDGVRMNNAIYRGGHLQNVITLDNAIFEKAEILFGPGSVVYGSDALGGVVHFYTKDPVLADSTLKGTAAGNAFVRYASANGEKTGHVDVQVASRKIGFLTSFTLSDFGDLRQGGRRPPAMGALGLRNFYVTRLDGRDTVRANPDPDVQTPSGYRQYDFLQKVLFRPNGHLSHTLNFQYSTSSDVPRYDRLTDPGGNAPFRSAEWYYGPQKRLFASYTLNLRSDLPFYDQARLIAGYQRLEESRINRNFGRPDRNHRIEQVDVFTFTFDLNKQLRDHALRYGAEWNNNRVNSRAFAEDIATGARAPLDTRYPDGGSRMQTLAAYLTDTWTLNDRWILTGGIRYSHVTLGARFREKAFFPFPFDEVTGRNGALTGNVGLVFQPGRDWRFALVGSSGFRAPNVDDLSKVFESRPGNLIVPNPGLRPEYLYNAELSLGKAIAQRVHLEATGYYALYHNAITVQPFRLNGQDQVLYNGELSRVTANVNARRAYTTGFSLGLSADIAESLSLTSTLNYTYGRIRTDSTAYPLDHIPPLYGKTALSVKLRRFGGEFFVLYNGWKRLKDYYRNGEDNEQYATAAGMPAWYTLNCRASLQVNAFLALQAAVENALDRNYRVFASGISAPGRNVVVTIRGKF
ncbi:MAG: TonB-dependent receptor [Cytophagales bacterium]|nr:TonB-dependent receptor [Cytophagales bacterium]